MREEKELPELQKGEHDATWLSESTCKKCYLNDLCDISAAIIETREPRGKEMFVKWNMVCFISIAAERTAWEAAGSLPKKHACLPEDVLWWRRLSVQYVAIMVSLTAWSQIAGNLAHPVFVSTPILPLAVEESNSVNCESQPKKKQGQPVVKAESYQILKRLSLKQMSGGNWHPTWIPRDHLTES